MFHVGQLIKLKSDITIQGAVTKVIPADGENQYIVFTNSLGIRTYCESQISEMEDSRIAVFEDKREKFFFGLLEQVPVPIQVYRPDGLLIFANSAGLDLIHLPSFDVFGGSFNILTDPVIDTWGDVREEIKRSFDGETVRFENIKVPLQEIIKRFKIEEMCFDSSFQNIICFPIYDGKAQLKYVIHLFTTMSLFTGKEEIVKAKEYLEAHWFEDFDVEKVASAVNLSRYHFARIFKKYTSITPYSYYQELKIKKLKEVLGDKNLTIGEAFSACGLDYSGNYAKVFKKKVGMTPSQYRKSIET